MCSISVFARDQVFGKHGINLSANEQQKGRRNRRPLRWKLLWGSSEILERHLDGSHGARVAAVGTAYDPAECPVACEQLAPGSALLTRLQQSTQARPPWLSLWSTDDQTVQPPDSARLPGAVNVPLQSVCPGVDIQHSQLPNAPLVVGLVLRTLAGNRVTAPNPGDCASLESLGRTSSGYHGSLAPHMAMYQP